MFNFRKSFVLSGLRISAVVCLFVITMIAAFNLSGCGGSSAPPSVAVTATVAIVDGSGGASGSGAAQTTTLTATVTNDTSTNGTPDGVTWTVSGGGTLSNTTTTSATFTAPAATSSAQTVTITATSVADPSKSGTATITIPALIASTTTTAQLTDVVGTVYSLQLTISGGNGTNTWTTTPVSGSLPPGWTISTSGVLSGPTAPTAGQAGTYTFTVAVKDSGTYSANLTLTVTINPAPAITFGAAPTATGTFNTAYSSGVSATGGAGALTYAVTSGSLPTGLNPINSTTGAITGTLNTVGTYNFKVTATDGFGDTMVSPQYTIVVSATAQTITFPTIAAQTVGTPLTLSATASSGLAVSFASTTQTVCTVAGTTATFIASGSCTIQATQAGNTDYSAATMVPQSFTVNGKAQTITFGPIASQAVGTPLTLSATASSGLAVSFASTTQSVCTVAGTTATFIATGTCTIQATQPGNTTYAAATMVPQSFTVEAEGQTITFPTIATQTVGTPLTLSATASSNLTVSFASTTQTVCTVAGTTATFIATGTCTIQATQAGNSSYAAAPMVSQSFTVNGEVQSITFNNPTAQSVGELPLTLSASATSGLAVSFASTTPAVCTVASGKASFIAVGSCTIQATQVGNTTYAAATMVSQSFAVNQGAQSITFNNPGAQVVGTPLPLVATSNSAAGSTGLTVSFASTTPSVCTVAGTTATFIASGTCTIQATQAGNANYAAATMVPQSFTVNGEAQTINFPTITTQTVGTPLPLVATATSTLAVSFASTTPSVCTVASTTATFIASGTCTIQATQPGNTVYAAATMVPQSFTVNGEAQTINFTNPGTQYQATPLPLVATATSTLTVSFASTTQSVCTVAGTTATFIASGTCTIQATQAGNTAYAAAPMVPQSFTVVATLAVTSLATLQSGMVGSTYSQQLTASGGVVTSGYSWTVTSGAASMATLGLSLSSSGLLTAPAFGATGSATFTAQVSDNASTPHTASATLTVNVSNFTITISTPPPAFAVQGNSYSSGTFTATGGTGPYTWSIAQGSGFSYLPIGLGLGNTSAATNAITGTVSSSDPTGAYNFTVTVVDHNGLTATYPYTLTVYAPLTQTPNPNPLPSPVIVNQAYPGATITASGGSGNYSWTPISGNLTSVLTVNNNGNNLSISGTPASIGTYDLYVTLNDTTTNATTGQVHYTIVINEQTPVSLPAPNPTSLPAATQGVSYTGAINAGGGIAGYTWTINGVTVTGGGIPLSNGLSASTTGGNTLSITGTPGTTASVPLTDVVVTDSLGSHATNSYTITVNPNVPTGYRVSGTVTYAGTKTGWVYLELIPNSGCSNCNQNLGTAINATTTGSLSTGMGYYIHGVPNGTYTLKAFMDVVGQGNENANDPTGSLSSVTVTSSDLPGQAVTLTDPAVVTLGTSTPTWDPSQGVGTFNGGAVVSFDPICNGSGCNNGGIEMPTSYNLEYSTDSTFNSGFTHKSFPANGGNSPWVVTGLTNGQTYYFRAAGWVGSTSGNYTAAEPTGGLLIGAPTAGSLLSGTVSFTLPSGVSASGTTLYAGCYASGTIYADPITSPVSPQAYSVYVPNGTNCQIFGFIDLNNAGLIGGPGEISNTNGNGGAMVNVTVNGTTPGQNITLPSGNSVADVKTQTNSGGGGTNYGIGFQVAGQYKLPVAVELLSETPDVSGTVVDVVLPADIATGAFNGNNDFFDYWPAVTGTPVVGDSYTFNVTYSDGTSEQLTAAVTGVMNAFATSLSPTGTGVSTTPNFSWDYPSSASSYLYQFQLQDNSSNTIWQIPPQHSNSNGFASTISPFITWDVDPTNTGDLPSSSYLTSGGLHASTIYNWSITAYDANMNEAQAQASFTTATASLSLPASGPGPALAGYAFTGQITATGGSGSGVFTVNGTTIPQTGIANAVSFTGNDGLYAYSTGSNTLYIAGTPTTAENVSLNVSVKDSFSDTANQTYTLVVSAPPTGGAGNANNAKLNGTYVCKIDGYNDSDGSRWSSLSSLVANGSGTITSGVWDTNSRNNSSGAMSGTISSSSSYSVGEDYMGLMTLNSVITSGGTGTHTMTVAIALNDANGATTTATEIRMVEIDDVGLTPSGMHGSGVCYQANTGAFAASTLSGNSLAFSMQGENNSGVPKAYVGRMTLSAESATGGTGGAAGGTITSGIGDGMRLDQTGDKGLAFANTTTYPSTYTVPSSTTGRFTLSLTPTGSTSTTTWVAYIIDSDRMFWLETAGDTGLLAGDMRLQQQSANTAAALLDGSAVLYAQGFEGNSSGSVTGYQSSVYQVIDASTSTYAGTLTVNASYDDDAGSYSAGSENGQSPAITLDSSNPGRATFSPGSDSGFFYFYNAGSAFYLSLNGTNHDLQTGWLEAQTQPSSPPFANASIAGSFLGGSLPRLNSGSNDSISEGTLDSSGDMTGSNTTANAGSLQWDQPFSAMGTLGYSWLSTTYGAFSNSMNGTAFQSCIVITPVNSGSTGKAVCMENTSGGANVSISEQ